MGRVLAGRAFAGAAGLFVAPPLQVVGCSLGATVTWSRQGASTRGARNRSRHCWGYCVRQWLGGLDGLGEAFDTLCETCYASPVKTITIRDLRQRWPEAEAALELEGEIMVTRDSRPVARLVRVTQPEVRRPRWSPEEHRKWIKKTFGNKVFANSDDQLGIARQDRKLT